MLPGIDAVSRSRRRGECGQRDRGQTHEQETTNVLEQNNRQSSLDVRIAVLNDTLEDAFRYRYPGFRASNDDPVLSAVA